MMCAEKLSSQLSEFFRFDNLEGVMKSEDPEWQYPPVSIEMFRLYFKDLVEAGLLPKPQKRLAPGPLNGRVAFVTGASSGIGKAISLALAERGAKVALGARRVDKLKEVKTKIEQEFEGQAVVLQMDVTCEKQVKQAVEAAELALGRIDILINNAGCMVYTKMETGDLAQWMKQVDVNIRGILNTLSVVLPRMCQSGSGGHIVNISSDAGRRPFPGLAVYSGTKFFVEGMSGALRQEVAAKNVRVTCIQPGDTQTEISNNERDEETQVRKEFGGDPTTTKFLDPEDVAEAVVTAVMAPGHVGINEILIEPKDAPL